MFLRGSSEITYGVLVVGAILLVPGVKTDKNNELP